MENKQSINIVEDITLVTFKNIEYDLSILSSMFEEIGSLGIDVDMISLSPSQQESTCVSFTIKDEDLPGILKYASKLKKQGDIKFTVCSGNCKVSILDESMENSPGFASKVFKAISLVNTDLRLITTSEVQISILVDTASESEVINAIKKAI